MESTLKADILAALKKERDRLNAIKSLPEEESDRLSLCIEFIKKINQGGAEMNITTIWQGPIRLD